MPEPCEHISGKTYLYGRVDGRGFTRTTCRECGKFIGYKPPDDYRSVAKKPNDEEWQITRKLQQEEIDWSE